MSAPSKIRPVLSPNAYHLPKEAECQCASRTALTDPLVLTRHMPYVHCYPSAHLQVTSLVVSSSARTSACWHTPWRCTLDSRRQQSSTAALSGTYMQVGAPLPGSGRSGCAHADSKGGDICKPTLTCCRDVFPAWPCDDCGLRSTRAIHSTTGMCMLLRAAADLQASCCLAVCCLV
jgi:hypothetical protein